MRSAGNPQRWLTIYMLWTRMAQFVGFCAIFATRCLDWRRIAPVGCEPPPITSIEKSLKALGCLVIGVESEREDTTQSVEKRFLLGRRSPGKAEDTLINNENIVIDGTRKTPIIAPAP